MIFRYFAQILLHRPDLYWTTYRIYPQCNVPQFFSSFHQTGCDLFHFFHGKITGGSGAKLRHTHVVLFWFVHAEIPSSVLWNKKETAEAISLYFHSPPANDKNSNPVSNIWVSKVKKIVHITKKNVIRFLFVFSCWITRMSFSHSSGNWNKSFSFWNSM